MDLPIDIDTPITANPAASPRLTLFRGEYNAELGGLMAASTVMILPVVILFFLTQRTFI